MPRTKSMERPWPSFLQEVGNLHPSNILFLGGVGAGLGNEDFGLLCETVHGLCPCQKGVDIPFVPGEEEGEGGK